jgi:hypothetical protein
MQKIITAAAIFTPLLLAQPALAQSRTAAKYSAPRVTPVREDLAHEFDDREAAAPRARGNRLLGGWEADNMLVGVGLFRVPKMADRSDPNRNQPLRDPSGKTTGVAAVGMSLRF